MTSRESEVKALLDRWSEACRAKNIDQLMTLYAPDITYFDIVPPLQFKGTEAVRGNFLRWFDSWASPIGMETSDLTIIVTEDVAVTHMLHQASGTLKNGQEVSYWVRATVCCQRLNDTWLIAHEHISLPINPVSRTAVMDLLP